MSGTAKISSHQLVSLVATFHEAPLMLFVAAPMAAAAGAGSWLAVWVGMLLGALPVAIVLHKLLQYHPGRSFGEIAETCLGRWAGKGVGLLLAGFSLFVTSLTIRNVMDFSAVMILPGTPVWATGLLFTFTVAYLAAGGAEVLVRISLLVLLLKGVSMVIIPIGLMGEMSVIRVLPLLEGGVRPLLKAASPTIGWFAQYWLLAPFLGLLDRPKKAFFGLMGGTMLGASYLALIVLFTLLTFGSDLTARFTFPVYAMVQEVSAGEFMERLEIALITVWLGGMVISAGASLWCASVTAGRVMGLKSDRWLILPLGLSALGLTFIWRSFMQVTQLSGSGLWNRITMPLAVGLPSLLLVISWWRARSRRAGVSA